MRSLFVSFRNSASSGDLVDLAVGLAIGAAFAAVVDSLVGDVVLPLVAAVFGQPDLTALSVTLNGSEVKHGSSITAFVAFLLLALVIMLLVQAVRKANGREAAGAQGSRECDHCKSFVPVDASVCMCCTSDIEPLVVG